jgi:hypothetical protein
MVASLNQFYEETVEGTFPGSEYPDNLPAYGLLKVIETNQPEKLLCEFIWQVYLVSLSG